MNSSQKVTTIQHSEWDEDGEEVFIYLEEAWLDGYGGYGFSSTEQVELALDLSEKPLEEQIKIFAQYQEENPDFECKIVTITISITREEMSLDENEYREARQRLALEKLNEGDMKALGVMNIFTYIKTKFHNA